MIISTASQVLGMSTALWALAISVLSFAADTTSDLPHRRARIMRDVV